MKYCLFILSFFIFFSYSTFSQNSKNYLSSEKSLIQFNIDNWNKEKGLPTNSLIDICQTDDGYIWISSYSGLIRFNGVQFKIFDKTNTTVFKENGIGDLATDKEGTLWMTTQSSGLISYKDGKFKSFGTDQNLDNLSTVIFIDSKDQIWSSSNEGDWFVFDKNSFKSLKYSSSFNNINLQDISETKDGILWFATAGKGLFKFEHNKFITYTTEEGLISNWIRTLYIDDNDLIWLGTDKGLCTFNGEKFEIIPELIGYTINRITTDNSGNFWFATTEGLFRKNHNTNTYEYLSTSNGLYNNYINNFLIDRENILWLINYKSGFSRIKNSKFISYTKRKGMSGKIVNSVCEYAPDSYLTAFDNGYINKIENGIIYEFKTKTSLVGMRIRNILKDSKNNLWISTYSGLLKISSDNKEKWYLEETGFPGKYIRLTFEDSKNNIWIGTRNNGLIKINKDKTYKVFNKSKGLSANLIMSIDEDQSGNIIVGTSKGGINIILNDKIVRKYSKDDGLTGDIIFSTYIDSAGNIWIATNGGLNCLKNGKLLSFNILHSTPYDIVEDNNGYFWIPSGKGIIYINKQHLLNYKSGKIDTFICKLYDKHDGIIQSECTSTSMSLKGSDGTLWFPTINGITMINPNNLILNDYIPPVYIEELLVNNSPVNINESIIIKPGKNRFTFNYTALSYHEPQSILFKYKLEGFEDEWSEADTKRSISYTNLHHGDYIFKVIACNNDGLWNMEGSQITFIVKPHFYETILFYFIVGILTLFFIYFIYRIRVRNLKNEQKKLEDIVNERTLEIREKNKEISRQNAELYRYQEHLEDMIKERTNDLEIEKLNAEKADQLKTSFLENLSHEIRTPLNAIVGFSTLLENEENISKNALESITNINSGSSSLIRIVDSIMQASRIQLGDIQLYESEFSIYNLIKEIYYEFKTSVIFQKKDNVLLKYNAESVKDILITCDNERLYTILYNLIENALKYTEKGFVEFGVTVEKENLLQFYIKDTGIGIAPKDLNYIFDKFRKVETDKSILYRGLGLGLNISKNLVKILNGKIRVESDWGKGSVFYFSIPIKKKKKLATFKENTHLIDFVNLNISGKKILIAEDEKLNLLFLETFLRNSGAEILTAENGLEAVDKFKQNNDIDLILMDIKMPNIDGIEATKQIRKLFKDNKVKIIAQTAYTIDYQKMKILNSGFDDYIEKPIDVYMMMHVINKHLNII
ncbi:MAG: response regulator [Bacteroidales bacterium]|nr:response regulator [Bacteroidales bacterium]